MTKPTPSQLQYVRHLLKQQGQPEPDLDSMDQIEVSALIDGLKAKRGRAVWYGNGQFSHWEKAAAERRARAVKVHKGSVATLAEEMHDALLELTEGETEPLGTGLLWQRRRPFTAFSVDGKELEVHLGLKGIHASLRDPYVESGHAGRTPQGQDVIVIEVNGSIPANDLHKSMSGGLSNSLVYTGLFKVLLHELTHVVDTHRQEAEVKRDEIGGNLEGYYNDPSEYKAYTQEVIDELEGQAERYPQLLKHFGPGRALTMFLNFSPTWGVVSEHWTEANKRRTIKSVSQHLNDWLEELKPKTATERVMTMYDYNRKTAGRFDEVTHKAAEAEKKLGEAYLALHSYKAGLDAMDEIPASLVPLYDQCLKALGKLDPAQKEATQLAGMTRRVLSRM